ncbi:uncharacterized protein LOC129411191 [Boleophthalmus pectinirostris]|uniref:uncharacterized protein LOC129411191 n=1 Tax=Boleophthalmus pectinirostris TaxID=150288 RepID=UPI00242FD847|nr:uncharacterized protein LOC129411191 [Boleophthalmus pectinirostris]
MSFLHSSPRPTDGNTTPVSNYTFIDNSTSTSAFGPDADFLDKITANDITSRANYVYSFLSALGFVAACFLVYGFVLAFRAQRRVAWLDCLLWAFCVLQLLLLLLSLYAVAHRPHYLRTTGLGCAALSFTINTVFTSSLLVLVLLAYVLSMDPPSNALLRKPGVCAALVLLSSVLISLMLAGIGGPRQEDRCFMDPVCLPYAVAKLLLAILVPYIIQMALLIAGCVRQWKTRGRFLSGSEEGPVFVTVSLILFICGLFYSVVLMRAALLQKENELSPKEEAFLNVFEFVFFSGSSFSLVLVLLLHRPCRETLKAVIRQMQDCCKRPGQAQTNRNIIAPTIEISDTLQDIEP